MESFDQRGGLDGKLGRHQAKDIPAGLSWGQMGPGIRAGLKPKRRRRRFWWWLPVGLSVALAIVGYFSFFGERARLGYFPVPGQPVGTTPAIAKTATEMPEEIKGANKAGIAISPDGPKAKGGPNGLVASSNPAERKASVPSTSKAASTPTNPLNELKESQAVSADKAQDKLVGLDLLNQIEALAPGPVVSLDSTTPYPEVQKMQAVRDPWIVEAGIGLAFNLSPDIYSAKLPNTTIDPLSGLAASLRIGYALPQRPYTLWGGIEMEELVQRERLQEAFPIQLYQPNTVDTIFRNTITGEEFTSTTDSIPGIRQVNIQQHSTFRSWSIPVLIGRAWAAAGWQLEGKAGFDFNLSSWRSGGYLTEGYTVASASNRYQTGWALRLEGQLLLPPVRFGRLFLRGGYRRSLSQQEGLVQGSLFRPEAIGLTMGWRVEW
ncbi:hypothetical protein [Phaeodactylibacter luteus]|uniref:Uncharacterized protein n=1 Tax=Phaeodactylibacter luteus TaxID=1564516 RepID=A0A5C6S5E8_9BACT|nr:hypothetical protein [Phaeodactylibacter luteus]TXB68833.1 hypothetical protein FRY97_01860 [Phaeodactylibacter luteus]